MAILLMEFCPAVSEREKAYSYSYIIKRELH